MTTRFAGSRSLDERRRRRLAGETEPREQGYEPSAPREFSANSPESETNTVADELALGDVRVSHFPVSRLISPKLWKIWAVGLLGLLVGVNLVVAGATAPTAGAQFGPGFSSLFDLETGHALKPFATLLMLVSAQLAWFIWWVRSRSPRDFSGRYRVWCWCAILAFAGTLAAACNLHHAWSLTAEWLWDLQFWNHATIIWLGPVALASLWAVRAMHKEMRDCRSSLTLLWLAAACGLGLAVLQLEVVPLTFPKQEARIVNWSIELAACWLLSMSLLLHARHVVHVTPDPARLRPPLWRLLTTLRLPKLPKRRRKPESPKQKSETTKAKPKPAGDSAKPETSTAKRTPTVAQATKQPVVSAKIDRQTKASEEADAPPATLKVADPPAPQSSAGLSKRERRRLRKQQRDTKESDKQERRAA